MSEWQPIDSAPKDGTLVAVTGLNNNTGPGRWIEIAGYCEGEWRTNTGEEFTDNELYPPTHWLPLPAPPSAEALDSERAADAERAFHAGEASQ